MGCEDRDAPAGRDTARVRIAKRHNAVGLGLSVFFVFALAKLMVLPGQDLQPLVWMAPGFLLQDALFAIVAGWLLALLINRSRGAGWLAYAVLCAYAAFNVPLTRALSSPLTLQICRAAGGALSDSIERYVTGTNCALITAVLMAGLIAPLLLRRMSPRFRFALAFAICSLVTLGSQFARTADMAGFNRNAVFAFISSCFPRIGPLEVVSNWRLTDMPVQSDPELSNVRASMAGRNVVVIVLESTAAQYLPLSHGTDVAQTGAPEPMPNLSVLASDAIIAENAYCVYPESIKGLFSVLCSRYSSFDIPVERLARTTTPSLASVLRNNGYHTGLFHSGRFMYLGMDAIVENRGFETLEDAGAIGGNFNSSFGVDEPAAVDRMLRWVDQIKPGEHFFLMYLPIAGHHPYDVPQPGPFPARNEQDRYLNSLHYGDRSLGDLFRGLKERGAFTNTLFVIFGDHGEAFGQHDGNWAHTFFLYEENVHVPCIIAAPGKIAGQTRLLNAVSLVDITPTILDLLGLKIPPAFQGSSLLDATPRRSLFYTDYSLPLIGLRDGDWKFIAQIDGRRSQLYDLARDPNERTNLCARFPDRAVSYRKLLAQWSSAQKARYTQ